MRPRCRSRRPPRTLLQPEEWRTNLDNERLPVYPDHPEPDQRIDSSEFEKESKPRTMPGTMVWMGLALMIGLYFTQKFIADHFGKDRPQGPVAAKPRGN